MAESLRCSDVEEDHKEGGRVRREEQGVRGASGDRHQRSRRGVAWRSEARRGETRADARLGEATRCERAGRRLGAAAE